MRKSGFRTTFEAHAKAVQDAGLPVTTDPGEEHDILHLHFFGPKSLYHLWRAHRLGRKVVTHAHSMGAHDLRNSFTLLNGFAPLYERYLKFFLDQGDCVCTPSEYARQTLIAQGVRKPVAVVYNSVDRTRFVMSAERRERWRRQLGLERFTVIAAGNVIPRKGIVDFLSVAKALPEFTFVWFGHHWPRLLTYWPEMHAALAARSANVLMPGFVPDPVGAYAVGDLFFFPSWAENQPVALLEAASLGLPLVVRDLPEYRGWLRPGVNCLVGRGVEDFVESVRRVACDPELRARLSGGARALADAHSLSAVGARLREVYENLMNGGLDHVL